MIITKQSGFALLTLFRGCILHFWRNHITKDEDLVIKGGCKTLGGSQNATQDSTDATKIDRLPPVVKVQSQLSDNIHVPGSVTVNR